MLRTCLGQGPVSGRPESQAPNVAELAAEKPHETLARGMYPSLHQTVHEVRQRVLRHHARRAFTLPLTSPVPWQPQPARQQNRPSSHSTAPLISAVRIWSG